MILNVAKKSGLTGHGVSKGVTMNGKAEQKTLRVGYGSAYENDKIEQGVTIAEKGEVRYLCFDTLAERTLAFAQQRKLADPTKGYNPLTEERLRATLPHCVKNKTKIISNMGAANPIAAADAATRVVEEMGFSGITIATVIGDDVRDLLTPEMMVWETGEPLEKLKGEIVSANAYLGADPIVAALELGADIVITGRTADPSLFLAPLIYEFGWKKDDWNLLGRGIVLGHLVECASHVAGGSYFDPGYTEDIPDPAHLGAPIVEVWENGEGVISKVRGTGGRINVHSCKAQLLYEVHDPSHYITPDVVADFSQVTFEQMGDDAVKVRGGGGKQRPDKLKVTIGLKEGYIGEGQIGWGGPGCYEKAKIAANAIRNNLRKFSDEIEELRFDFIGVNSIFGEMAPEPSSQPNEVRLRVAGRTRNPEIADRIGYETELMYFGPVGAGGAARNIRQVMGMYSTLISRDKVPLRIISRRSIMQEVK